MGAAAAFSRACRVAGIRAATHNNEEMGKRMIGKFKLSPVRLLSRERAPLIVPPVVRPAKAQPMVTRGTDAFQFWKLNGGALENHLPQLDPEGCPRAA